MAVDTTTVRLARPVRDQAASLANESGQTLSSFLAGLIEQERRARLVAAEREASTQDALDPAARAEYDLWENTLADDVD
jgi:hypothetical protein